jgi:hypothetical protein
MVNKQLLKNLETNRNSIEELSAYTRRINENAWSFSYLYPEDFGPAKFPDNNSFPTTISTNRMIRQFKVNNNGEFIIYFSPVTETFASYFNPDKAVGVPLDRGNLSEYIVYADSDGGNIPLNGNVLSNASTWSHINRPAPKFQNLRMIRLIGASLELFVDDSQKNYSGIIEAGMGFAVAGAGLYADSIDPERIQNFSRYSRFVPKTPLVCRYRAPNSNFMEFGPYEPYMQVPYYIIRGKGLPTTSTIGVIMTNHVEGVFWPEMAHFAYKPKFSQIPGNIQRMNVEKIAGQTAMQTNIKTTVGERASQNGILLGDLKIYDPRIGNPDNNWRGWDDVLPETKEKIKKYAENKKEVTWADVELPLKFKYIPKKDQKEGVSIDDPRPIIKLPDFSDNNSFQKFPAYKEAPNMNETENTNEQGIDNLKISTESIRAQRAKESNEEELKRKSANEYARFLKQQELYGTSSLVFMPFSFIDDKTKESTWGNTNKSTWLGPYNTNYDSPNPAA